jgi:hypothetical protein
MGGKGSKDEGKGKKKGPTLVDSQGRRADRSSAWVDAPRETRPAKQARTGDWDCGYCGNFNYGSSNTCRTCSSSWGESATQARCVRLGLHTNYQVARTCTDPEEWAKKGEFFKLLNVTSTQIRCHPYGTGSMLSK